MGVFSHLTFADKGYRPALRGLAMAFFVLLAACAAPFPPKDAAYDRTAAVTLFAKGFDDITEYYIDEIDVSRLALAGIDNLSTIDPELDVIEHGDALTLRYAGQSISRFGFPQRLDNDAWARLTAAVIETAQTRSESFQRANGEQIYQAVFDGMVGELDRFSHYDGPESAKENREDRTGFGGIGIRYINKEDGAHIINVMENAPANAVGLQPKDIIIAVDGRSIVGLTSRQVSRALKGPEYSPVRITVKRGEGEKLHFKIIRQHIVAQTVYYTTAGSIAHIQITSFNAETTSDLRSKIRQAHRDLGDALKGYVIDLRNNGGGLLRQAVLSADLFIASGPIVSVHGRHPDSHQFSGADSSDIARGLPIVVLVNGYSASAAEVLAAALQDSGRAVVVGSNSFGKGTVQHLFQLPNRGEIAVTWARFHSPAGYTIHQRGILPNICTTLEGTKSGDDVIQLLQSGKLPLPASVRTSRISDGDDSALERLKASCPQNKEVTELDNEVAERILSTPALLKLATGQIEPASLNLQPDSSSNNG